MSRSAPLVVLRDAVAIGVLVASVAVAARVGPIVLGLESTASPPFELGPCRSEQRGDLVFVGRVRSRDSAPGAWSGFATEYQAVTYDILEVRKGTVRGPIVVRHVVVHGDELAEPGRQPGLRRAVFKPGARLVIAAITNDRGEWFGTDVCRDAR